MFAAGFEWDEDKAAANLRKHGVGFVAALAIFTDPACVERLDIRSRYYGEDRFLLTGLCGGVLLTVVYTDRRDVVRIISARRATRSEHDDYFRQNSQ